KFRNAPATRRGEAIAEDFLGENEIRLKRPDRPGDGKCLAEVGVKLPFPRARPLSAGAPSVATKVTMCDPFIKCGGAFLQSILPGFSTKSQHRFHYRGAIGKFPRSAGDAREECDL